MKFENTVVFNFDGAFRGMRNPLNSWDKSDSFYSCIVTDKISSSYVIGEKDLALAQKLIKAGVSHRKFLRQVFVSVDITAPRYFWAEFDQYRINVTSNSTSTMHKLKDYPITIDMFQIDENDTENAYWRIVIGHLEGLRQNYNDTNDYKWFRLLKQALPESFLQMRTLTMNYENVLNIYNQRINHRLKQEWKNGFCNWCKTLPYFNELFNGVIND